MIIVPDAFRNYSELIASKRNELKCFWLTDGFWDVLKGRIVGNVDSFQWSVYIWYDFQIWVVFDPEGLNG